MECSWPENLPCDRRKAAEELIRGREFAEQLRVLLQKSEVEYGSVSPWPTEDLVLKILNSFTNSISMLETTKKEEVSEVLVNNNCANSTSSWNAKKSEDSGESCKSSSGFKDRRGCYKRRKTSHTWARETSTLSDDGHAWRKYGQKVILNAPFPRQYYKCTHKTDQNCQATKQVQQIEQDPPKYRTTYYGNHTCNNHLQSPQLIIDGTHNYNHHHLSSDSKSSSYLLSFDGATTAPSPICNHYLPVPAATSHIDQQSHDHNNNNNDASSIFSSISSSVMAVKQELINNNNDDHHDHDTLSDVAYHVHSSSTSEDDFLMSSAFHSTSLHLPSLSSSFDSDPGDVISGHHFDADPLPFGY